MNKRLENIDNIVQNWLNSAEQDYTTMLHLIDSEDYSWALFLGHLVIEKTLKALYVSKHKQHAIFTHDLLRLASKTGLEIAEEQQEWLDEITTFNLNVRYDSYKQDFYKLCTKEFTEEWVDRIKIIRKWLKSQF